MSSESDGGFAAGRAWRRARPVQSGSCCIARVTEVGAQPTTLGNIGRSYPPSLSLILVAQRCPLRSKHAASLRAIPLFVLLVI